MAKKAREKLPAIQVTGCQDCPLRSETSPVLLACNFPLARSLRHLRPTLGWNIDIGFFVEHGSCPGHKYDQVIEFPREGEK